MKRGLEMPPEVDPYTLAELTADYLCPVCGTGLAQSDFDTPERDYYCPYCSTRQTPSVR
jgi:DNA-directed RNA polymerase subunit RPC12/RpoP